MAFQIRYDAPDAEILELQMERGFLESLLPPVNPGEPDEEE